MKLGPGICRQPDDVTGIWWDLRCEQNDMKHQPPKLHDENKDPPAYAVSVHSASLSPSVLIAMANQQIDTN